MILGTARGWHPWETSGVQGRTRPGLSLTFWFQFFLNRNGTREGILSIISASLSGYPFSPPIVCRPTGDEKLDAQEEVFLEVPTAPSSPGDGHVPIPGDLGRRFSLQTTGPTPDVQRQVADILQSFASVPLPDDPGPLVSAQHYYPVWCVLLYATLGAGYGTSIDFQTGAEHPNAGLHYLPVMVAGLGQAGDTKITWDGIREAMAGREHELEACHVYLNAASALEALASLEAELMQRPKPQQNLHDATLIAQARAQLQALADTHAVTFQKCLEPGYLVPRCALAGMRDVGIGSLSLLKTVPTAVVSGLSTSGPLSDAAKGVATTLPYLSSSMSLATGVLHILQAILEGVDARRTRASLLQAEQFDKNVFQAHGADCPALLELMEHRHQWRELNRLDTHLLDIHSWVRGIYGGTSLGGAVVSTALTALGGAAVFGAAGMGIPGLVGIFLAGCYMLWYGIRANVREAEQKKHDKACRTVNAHHARQAEQMPGLADPQRGRPIQAVARDLVDRLLAPQTQNSTRQMLIALGLSPSAIDATIDGHRGPLTDLIVQLGSQAGLPSETESLRHHHARSDVSVWDQVVGLERWMSLGNKAKDIALPPTPVKPGWTQYLAAGAAMKDLRQSSLTQRLIRRHWQDAGFQPALQGLRVHDHEKMTTPEDAWHLLEVRRGEVKQAAQARATVAGWVANGQWRNIEACLRDRHDFAHVKYQQALQDDHGLLPQDAGNILAVLRQRAQTWPLQADTIAPFMAICKASDAAGKRALVPQVQALVDATVRSMPADGAAFHAALGITASQGIDAHNVDAVLVGLQQFLSVSEKLRSQTLSKVVISLHTYPTEDFPQALGHLAALRELRLRCETAGRAPDDVDLQHALTLARKLSDQKLHTRAWGAGEGGGVFGFGGYRLNEKGAFLRQLFERCLSGQPSPASLSPATLTQLWQKSSDGAYREALIHGARQLAGGPFKAPTDAAQLVHFVALYSKPGALEKALRSRDPHQRETAMVCLKAQLTAAREQAESTFGDPACVTHLQAFFRFEKLAQQHGVPAPTPRLGASPDPKRIEFYRAALAWPNKTALAKNIQAIRFELEQLKQGTATGNAFWSAKFLRSQGAAGAFEHEKMRERHPGIGAVTSYKGLVTTLKALDRMKVPALQKALVKNEERAWQGIAVHFKSRGLPPPIDRHQALGALKKAAKEGRLALLMALSALKTEAGRQLAEKRAKAGWSRTGSPNQSTKEPSDVLL